MLPVGFGLLLAGASCQPYAQESPPLSEADVAAIEAFHQSFLEAEVAAHITFRGTQRWLAEPRIR